MTSRLLSGFRGAANAGDAILSMIATVLPSGILPAIAKPSVLSACSISVLLALPVTVSANTQQANSTELKDLFFGEALFHAYQDQYFDAIVSLDTELKQYHLLDSPELDPFSAHLGSAEFSVGDLELSYRMHREAGRAIEAVLKGNVSQSVRNEAAYRLAKIQYHKQQPRNALDALQMIEGEVPAAVRADEQFLRARVYMELGRFEEAADLLRKLKGEKSLRGFAEFNLGIALLKSGQTERGVLELDQLGRHGGGDASMQALRDKTNLLLGYQLTEAGELERARPYFDRVQLSGPFSNRALLGAGWVEAHAGRYDRALVPWSMLQQRKSTNSAVQEAMLAVPYAYGKLEVHSTAAVNYGQALDVFGEQVDVLSNSIDSIRSGKFLEALRRKEAPQVKNWVVSLRSLPGAPETHYLLDLMSSNDYQEFLKNYQDLNNLFERNESWLQSLLAYEDLIRLRRAYYEPILPELDDRFRKIDARIELRMQQRARLASRIDQMLVSRRPEYLANSDEQRARLQLQNISRILERNPETISSEIYDRTQRLQGVVNWRLESEYDVRLTEAYKHLQQLDEVIEKLQTVYQGYVRSRQAATHSYEGYNDQITRLRSGLEASQDRLEMLMARQGKMLETLAINELDQRRARLESYQIKARFALADSFDRANELQELRQDQQKIQQYQQEQERLLRSSPETEQSQEGSQEQIPQNNPPELEAPAASEPPAASEQSTKAKSGKSSEGGVQ